MSEAERPDPDALLARLKREETASARGKLKIFFGMSPGDEVSVDGALVTVLSTTGRRVRKVRVTKVAPTEPAATGEH